MSRNEAPPYIDTYLGVSDLETYSRDLSSHEVARLEVALRDTPDDLQIRALLLLYFGRRRIFNKTRREKHAVHALWVIENKPESALAGHHDAGFIPIFEEKESYRQGQQLWLDHVTREPHNVRILANAANYFLFTDKKRSEEYLLTVSELEPQNMKWAKELAHLYSLMIGRSSSPAEIKETRRKALQEQERAYHLAPNERDKFWMLEKLPRYAFEAEEFDKSSNYSQMVLDQISPESRKRYGDAIHDVNDTLGRLALRRGDKKSAKEFLKRAGDTPGSPVLGSFGPRMLLADELLQSGDRFAVIDYLFRCMKFLHEPKLVLWCCLILIGAKPKFRT
jgi:hypothetical protein